MKIINHDKMSGIKIGLFLPGKDLIYTSKEVALLCKSELDLMKKYLKVVKMPSHVSSFEQCIEYLRTVDKGLFSKKVWLQIELLFKNE